MEIDKYLNQLNLDIKSRDHNKINIRCPICGDSRSNKFKARGYIMLEREQPIYNCFNECGSMSFYNFLKGINITVAEQYKKDQTYEWIKSKERKKEISASSLVSKKEVQEVEPIQEDISKFRLFDRMYYKTTVNEKEIEQELDITDLTEEAIIYLQSRGFKEEDYKDFKFCKETNDIIIPYWYDKSRNLIYGVQSRNIFDKRFHLNFFNHPKVSNLYEILTLLEDSEIFVFESEFDRISSGIINSISSLGVSLSKDIYEELSKKYKLIFVLDADESGDIAIMKYAKLGHKVLVHDQGMYHFKDFNKLLELGQSKADIQKYIIDNIKSSKIAIIELIRRGIKI